MNDAEYATHLADLYVNNTKTHQDGAKRAMRLAVEHKSRAYRGDPLKAPVWTWAGDAMERFAKTHYTAQEKADIKGAGGWDAVDWPNVADSVLDESGPPTLATILVENMQPNSGGKALAGGPWRRKPAARKSAGRTASRAARRRGAR